MRMVRIGLLLGPLAALACAQQQIPFQLVATQSGASVTLQNGGALTFVAPVGQTSTAQLKVTYTGAGKATISQQPVLTGSTTFSAMVDPASATLPLTLNPGATVPIIIQFKPASSSAVTAQFNLSYAEAVPSANGGDPVVTNGAIAIGLAGSSSSFVFSYILQTDQNVATVAPGGTLTFPPTLTNTTATAAFSITNTGSGAGQVTAISISGSAFRITGKPLLPFALLAGQTLEVQLLYQPTAPSSDAGQLQISFDSGSPATINLAGSGVSSAFVYQVLTSPPTVVPSGGTVPIPDTSVGQTNSVVVKILNNGPVSSAVNGISVTGAGYTLSNLPALPQTVASNSSLTFTLNFAPTAPGAQKGSLLINSDSLALAGVGLGAQLSYSYTIGGTTVNLGTANTSVIFSPVTVSQSAQATFDVKNTGTQAATIANIGIGQVGSPYTLSGLPPLPVSVPAGADFQFKLTFTPAALGFSNGTLLIDTATINLIGSGTQPPDLPAYTIGGASGSVSAGSQPNITLTLAKPYPVALSGVLTASASGNLPADPAVLFSNGLASVPFTIAANSTSAVFGTQGTQIGLQTGTVAGTITLTPSFATKAGGIDLTPANPTVLPLTIASAAPTLIGVTLTSTADSLTIAISGFATTRSLTSATVQFTTAAGFKLPVNNFTIDVQQASNIYFQSAASKAFGGQFTLTIPFTFQGTAPTGQSLVNSISSVSVTVSNSIGASNALQASN